MEPEGINVRLRPSGSNGFDVVDPRVTIREGGSDRRQRVANLVKQVLTAMDVDVEHEEDFCETPLRVAKMYEEFFRHQDSDLQEVLKDGFTLTSEPGLVVQQNIPFRAMCPHHLLPVLGKAAIGYVPRKKIVGLSKLSRIVDIAGTIRPDTQEAIGSKIAEALYTRLDCQGVIVHIEAMHTCMCSRGVRTPADTVTTTSHVKGIFRDVPAVRQEFFSCLRK
jgi:GTP cyclohydrolase I